MSSIWSFVLICFQHGAWEIQHGAQAGLKAVDRRFWTGFGVSTHRWSHELTQMGDI